MSKRSYDINYGKTSRNDRFAQMSFQEKLIEQKKLEIQAKIEAKKNKQKDIEQKDGQSDASFYSDRNSCSIIKDDIVKQDVNLPINSPNGINIFSNDGTFLDQFKQMKKKKVDAKFKAFNKFRIKEIEKERENTQVKSDTSRRTATRSLSPSVEHGLRLTTMEINQKRRSACDRLHLNPADHQKITINTAFSNTNNYSQDNNLDDRDVNNLNAGQLPFHSFGEEFTSNKAKCNSTLTWISIDSLSSEYLSNSKLVSTTDANLLLLRPSILTDGIEASQNLATPSPSIVSNSDIPSLVQPAPILKQKVLVAAQSATSVSNTTDQQQKIGQAAAPGLMNMPPPQIVSQTQLVVTQQTQNILESARTTILTSVRLSPTVITPQHINVTTSNMIIRPPVISSVEASLTSIPPPNPIQVQNIPQPEPLSALNIPSPVPIQVQNIPTPTQLQLNEIPNPKPLDLLTIPTPESKEISMSNSEFIKNIPPPNKNIPPPNLSEVNTILPPPIIKAVLSPNTSQQRILLHNISDQPVETSNPDTCLDVASTEVSLLCTLQQPPPTTLTQQSAMSSIPSLMSHPVLPPPRMGVNVLPPSLLPDHLSQLPPNFLTYAPHTLRPLSTQNHLPNMTLPPPSVRSSDTIGMLINTTTAGFKNQITGGGAEHEAMTALARMVADCGPSVEDVVRKKKDQDPNLWFLFHKDCATYRQYANLVEQYKKETLLLASVVTDQMQKKGNNKINDQHHVSEKYEPEVGLVDENELNRNNHNKHYACQKFHEVEKNVNASCCNNSNLENMKLRKKKSRWGDKDVNVERSNSISTAPTTSDIAQGSLTNVTRSDPGLLQYTVQSYGTIVLSEEDWKKAEDNYKIHLLYLDMLKKREDVKRLNLKSQNKYEYDSDEDTEGGTWEHKLREKEMQATEKWATELTRQAEGKHHIGDFLPPEELKRFLNKTEVFKEGRQPNFSDYKEFKIKEDNIGFKMLQKLGWTEGQGLGHNSTGILEPINKGPQRENTLGLGLNSTRELGEEDVYQSYRRRMMLAYRFRPNPLNNPRRPYY